MHHIGKSLQRVSRRCKMHRPASITRKDQLPEATSLAISQFLLTDMSDIAPFRLSLQLEGHTADVSLGE